MAQGSMTPLAPIKPRARGPVQLALEVTVGLFFVAFFAWFIGLLIEAAGHHTLWKSEGAVEHSARITDQDLGYIAAAPRSLLIDDTQAFAHKLMGWVAFPYQRLGMVAAYNRLHADASDTVDARKPVARKRKKSGPLGGGVGGVGGVAAATDAVVRGVSYWSMVSMHVAQDVALRLSVALFALPAFLLACIVGIVDGLVRRDLRRWRGGRESSFIYHHAKHYTAWALTGGFGLYLTWPLGGFNPAYMVLVFALLVAATMSTTVASFKKYA